MAIEELPCMLPKPRPTSLHEAENGHGEPKSLTERVCEHVQAHYNAEYLAYTGGERPKPAPSDSPDRFTKIINELFEAEKKGFIEARLNGVLGESLDNTALRICFTGLASELVRALPAFSLYIKTKILEADKVKLPPILKDEVDLSIEQALSDRKTLKNLAIKLYRGEVREDGYLRGQDIERAKRYLRRRAYRKA